MVTTSIQFYPIFKNRPRATNVRHCADRAERMAGRQLEAGKTASSGAI